MVDPHLIFTVVSLVISLCVFLYFLKQLIFSSYDAEEEVGGRKRVEGDYSSDDEPIPRKTAPPSKPAKPAARSDGGKPSAPAKPDKSTPPQPEKESPKEKKPAEKEKQPEKATTETKANKRRQGARAKKDE
eukprot:TRINITY_DN19894_c0_g1_i3.p1 TRINITY_DN19894_c0_g1~~TRINITY_DN19894_c0_g1_i3.p1  ORF type:complete len:142 (-),score=26.32 TRINITY_DN19894_c0_g1_i3:80-472(-)